MNMFRRPASGLAFSHVVVLILAFAASTVLPTARAADVPTRFIVKWKTADSSTSAGTQTRVQALSSAGQTIQQQTGHVLKIHHAITDQVDVMQADRKLTATELHDTLHRLNMQAEVEYASVDERRHVLASLPNDPFITATSNRSGQWYLLTTEIASINAVGAWDYSHGGAAGTGVIVAVVDTGIRPDHPDLAGKLLPGYDFVTCDQSNCTGTGLTYFTANDGNGWDNNPADPGDWISSADITNHPGVFNSTDCTIENSSWHGTRVAGIIGAATNNGVGIAGIGWNARILPVRVLGKCGGYDSDIIAGMRWAAGLPVTGVPTNPNPAKIINLSLGSPGDCVTDTNSGGVHVTNLYAAYRDVIAQLTTAKVSVVASAGNDSAAVNAPANCTGVISVVGVRNTGTKVGFSSLGTATIAAPGGNCGTSASCAYSLDTTTNLGTTTPGANDYTDMTNSNLGTSFSAPIVSGTVALMLGMDATLTPAQIIDTLRSTAKTFPTTAAKTCQVPTGSTVITGINDAECNCTVNTCGAGLLDAYQAVLALSSSSSSSSTSSSSNSTSSSSASSSSSMSSSSSSASSVSRVVSAPGAGSSSGGGGAMDQRVLWMLLSLALIRIAWRSAIDATRSAQLTVNERQ